MKVRASATRVARRTTFGTLALCVVLMAQVARAEGASVLLAQHFAARGASSSKLLGQTFLFEGQALVRTLSFSEDGCRAVFAWGATGLRDLDLALYSSGGLALAEDNSAAPYGYARLCAAAGTTLYASAHAYSGRGEVSMIELDTAPRSMGRPPSALPLAVVAGGRASATRSVAGEEAELSVEVPLLHDEREVARAGYSALGPPTLLEVRAGLAEGILLLPPHACFRLLAFVPGARGLILEAESGEVAREARSADAELIRLALCSERSGPLAVRVRTRALRSLAVVRVFQHPGAKPAEAKLYGEERALQLAEARVLAAQRGFHLSSLGEVWVERGARVSWPVVMSRGACHMIAALTERGTEAELVLLDARGVVLARNEGRHGWAVLFTCANTEERAQLQVRGQAADGPVSLWLGSDGPS